MSEPRQLHNLALVGFMGTGKSSVGRLVARHLHFAFVDTDEAIEAQAQKPISALFAEQGEPTFRDFERQLVAKLEWQKRNVIATGGGLIVDPENLASLKRHALVICLWASPELIWERVRHQSNRPLLHDPEPLTKIRRLLEERKPFYCQADVMVNTHMRSLKEVAQQVSHQFQLARQGHK